MPPEKTIRTHAFLTGSYGGEFLATSDAADAFGFEGGERVWWRGGSGGAGGAGSGGSRCDGAGGITCIGRENVGWENMSACVVQGNRGVDQRGFGVHGRRDGDSGDWVWGLPAPGPGLEERLRRGCFLEGFWLGFRVGVGERGCGCGCGCGYSCGCKVRCVE